MPESLQDTLFNLKFAGKQLDRMAKKAEKAQDQEKSKMKKAMMQKDIERARIYGENAIRKKNESLNYMRMSARIDAVQSRVQTAVSMKGVIKQLGVITKGLDRAMQSMNLEEVEQIMQKFEQQFEELDVRESTMEQSMGSAMALSTPQNQIDDLIKQVADENDLDITEQLKDLQPGQSTVGAASVATSDSKEDNLSRRLAALRH